MDQLLAATSNKYLNLHRGDEIEGKIISILDNEVILDLGTKAEGILNKKEVLPDQLVLNNRLNVFVVQSENESGQVVLSTTRISTSRIVNDKKGGFDKSKRWQRFIQAQQQSSRLTGHVTEVNKGGLIVEVDGIRGFLPTSQISTKTFIDKKLDSLDKLIGTDLTVQVIEVNIPNNRLIFTDRLSVSEEARQRLSHYQNGQQVKGNIVAVLPFGIFLIVGEVEAVVYPQEASWDRIEGDELVKSYKVGQEVEGMVVGIDETLGRLNLSLKQLSADPFEKIAENFQVDDVVKGKVLEVGAEGVKIELDNKVEGFMSIDKVDQDNPYTVGQSTNFLVDSVDKNKRKINLAPFLTSTKGLIYK